MAFGQTPCDGLKSLKVSNATITTAQSVPAGPYAHRQQGREQRALGEAGVGGLAAATAMALRLNGISHWIMWEFAALFEHIGTVRDGMTILARPHTVVDAPGAKPLVVSRGEIRFDNMSFAYGEASGTVLRRIPPSHKLQRHNWRMPAYCISRTLLPITSRFRD